MGRWSCDEFMVVPTADCMRCQRQWYSMSPQIKCPWSGT